MRRLGLLALLVIAAIGAGAGWMDSQISRPYRGHRPEKVFVDIPHGTSRWNIAGILRRDDVIRNRLAFELFSLWHIRAPLQAGEYFIDHPVTTREVFWQVAQGRIFVHTVTIPEGWTMFDIAAEMDKEGVCNREEFLNAAQNSSLILDLAPNAKNLEGFLFPSTYEFNHHATCDQVVKRMVQNFRAVWESLNVSDANAFPQGLSAYQVVTLASLVERETPRREERPLVAGVFYNRLKHGGPLQCDPTVAYALELEGHPVKIVHAKDLQVDSPYNTYKNPGLPPGPIANPGEASLRAALVPAVTDYMFFVANDNGGHFFSKTLAEHNRNVAKYRRLLSGETAGEEAAAKKPSHRGPS
jgi:peptidoglycan lytic transglycosylase G